MTPFRYKVRDNETIAAGVVIALNIPAEDEIRYVYTFLERGTYNVLFAQGYEAHVRFYLNREMVMELPAALIPSVAGRIGMAGYQLALNTANSTGISGPDVLWWNTNGSNVQNPIHPFRLRIRADEVRLEHNTNVDVRAMLSVLSMPNYSR